MKRALSFKKRTARAAVCLLALLVLAQLLPGGVFPLAAKAAPATEIASAEDFAAITDFSGNYVQTRDITISPAQRMAGRFTGSYDGGGHSLTVRGGAAEMAGTAFGLFADELGGSASVKDLTIATSGTVAVSTKAKTSADSFIGGLAGKIASSARVEDVDFTGSLTASASPAASKSVLLKVFLGGIAGSLEGSATVAGAGMSGTLAGGGTQYTDDGTKQLYSYMVAAGGIAGRLAGSATVKDCTVGGKVYMGNSQRGGKAQSNGSCALFAGGIAGWAEGGTISGNTVQSAGLYADLGGKDAGGSWYAGSFGLSAGVSPFVRGYSADKITGNSVSASCTGTEAQDAAAALYSWQGGSIALASLNDFENYTLENLKAATGTAAGSAGGSIGSSAGTAGEAAPGADTTVYGITAAPAQGSVKPGDTIVFTAQPATATVYIEAMTGGDSPALPTQSSAHGTGSVSYTVPEGQSGILKVLAAIYQGGEIKYSTPQAFVFAVEGGGAAQPQSQDFGILAAGTASGITSAPATTSYVDLDQPITLTSTDTGTIQYASGVGTAPTDPDKVTWLGGTATSVTLNVSSSTADRGKNFYVVARTTLAGAGETPNDMRTFNYTIKQQARKPTTTATSPVLYGGTIELRNLESSGTIKYTLNGGPEQSYTAAIPVDGTTVANGKISIVAWVSGATNMVDSAKETFSFEVRLPAPTFSPAAGDIFYGDKLQFNLSGGITGATIRYTLDGTNPASSLTAKTVAQDTDIQLDLDLDPSLTLGRQFNLQAIAQLSPYQDSAGASGSYTIQPDLTLDPTPPATPEGRLLEPGKAVTMTTTANDSGTNPPKARVYYTYGTYNPGAVGEPLDPSFTDTNAQGTASLTIPADYGKILYIKASVRIGDTLYGPMHYQYRIMDRLDPPTAKTPTGSAVVEGATVELEAADGTIFYTTDPALGTSEEDKAKYTQYGTPVRITLADAVKNSSGQYQVTLKAFVKKTDNVDSEVVPFVYDLKAPAPVPSEATGNAILKGNDLTFTVPTGFADDGDTVIWYTYSMAAGDPADPQNPTSSSSPRYSDRKLLMSGSAGWKVKVKVFIQRTGYVNSDVLELNYTIGSNNDYNISPASPVMPNSPITVTAVDDEASVSVTGSGGATSDSGIGSATITAPNSYNTSFTITVDVNGSGGKATNYITMKQSRQPEAYLDSGLTTKLPSYGNSTGAEALPVGGRLWLSSPDGGKIYYVVGGTRFPEIKDENLYDESQGILITSQQQRVYAVAVGEDGTTAMAPSSTTDPGYYWRVWPTPPEPNIEPQTGTQMMRGSTAVLSIPASFPEFATIPTYYTIEYEGGTKSEVRSGPNIILDGEPGKEVTVRAYAKASYTAQSAEITATYKIIDVDDSIYSVPAAGSEVKPGDTIILSSNVSGGNVKIHYTTDGTTPTVNSPDTIGTPVVVTGKPKTVFAVRAIIAIGDTVLTPTPVQLDFPIGEVEIEAIPAADTIVKPGDDILLSTTVPGGTIHYTTDGSFPTASSPSGSVVKVSGAPGGSFLLKAIVVANGVEMAPATFTYKIMEQTSPPFASIPTGAVLLKGATVELSAAEGKIFYTTDGTTPTSSSRMYTEPLTFTASTVVKAIAVADDKIASAVAEFVYNLAGSVVAPAASLPNGTVNANTQVALSSQTAGATIYYTTNGVDPSASNLMDATLYDAPITIARAVTIKAIAVKEGLNPSVIASFTYTVAEPPPDEGDAEEEDEGAGGAGGDKLFQFDQYAAAGVDPQYPNVWKDRQTRVVVSAPDNVIPEGATLAVTQFTSPAKADIEAVERSLNLRLAAEYDVTLWQGSTQVQPQGEIEVGLPMPSELSDAVVQICRINDDGTVTPLSTRRASGVAYAETDHLSKYGIAVPIVETTVMPLWRTLLPPILIALAALAFIFLLLALRRRRRARVRALQNQVEALEELRTMDEMNAMGREELIEKMMAPMDGDGDDDGGAGDAPEAEGPGGPPPEDGPYEGEDDTDD